MSKPKYNLDTEATLCILAALRSAMEPEERHKLASIFEARAKHIEAISDLEYDQQVAKALRTYGTFASTGGDESTEQTLTDIRRTLH